MAAVGLTDPFDTDPQLLASLTIVVPTYERPEALARMLAYYAALPVQLLVVDGSAQPANLAAMQSLPAGLRYVHRPVPIEERIRWAVQQCDTEFAMFSCDDEYYLEDGLRAALAQLRAVPMLSAAAGRCAAFVCNDQGLQLGTYYNFLKGFSERSDLASQRVRTAAAHSPLLSGFYYSVCRTSAFRPAALAAFAQRFSCPYVQEVMFTLGLFMQGGMQTVPQLMWLRNLQAPPVSHAQWNRKLDLSAWYGAPDHADEVAQLHSLAHALYQSCLAADEVAEPLDAIFRQLVDFDARQVAGQGESQKAYPFALSAFLIMSRQFGLPVDAQSLHRVDALETAAQLAANQMAQLKARITVW